MFRAQRDCDRTDRRRHPSNAVVAVTYDLLNTNRELRETLAETQAESATLVDRLSRTADDLRDAMQSVASTVGAIATGHEAACPNILVINEETGHMHPVDGHEVLVRRTLAKIAAQLAGRHPDTMVRIELAGEVVFDDFAWRYPDFEERAERAFAELAP